ncbi:S-type pyocin domain-containing protein [Pseudomonas extremaustralis]|uniref:S-type pyocin domain-containing protein n=1 Tax=Pseudomonas extremaustralis TaxID=359110 RepID=UPI002AA0C2CF|nr:S-type pyocin domain-containing protein [Pseudomonas extremaustralis]
MPAQKALVHPVTENIDSQIEVYPASDDLTWQDCILVFPADSGVPPLYLVFAKPVVRPLEVDVYAAFTGRLRDGQQVDHCRHRQLFVATWKQTSEP